MTKDRKPAGIPLPAGWPQAVGSAMLHVISLAQFALAYTCGWALNSQVTRVRLKAENDRLRQQVALLTEEIRIKDARMRLTAAQRRPHYAPTERMSILELRAVLSAATFCTFVREFSPPGLRSGRIEEDTCAVAGGGRTGRFSSRRNCAHAASCDRGPARRSDCSEMAWLSRTAFRP